MLVDGGQGRRIDDADLHASLVARLRDTDLVPDLQRLSIGANVTRHRPLLLALATDLGEIREVRLDLHSERGPADDGRVVGNADRLDETRTHDAIDPDLEGILRQRRPDGSASGSRDAEHRDPAV